jgi:hypothetical protein
MNFGKNRVQYDKFEWYYYRYDRFDVYFYLGGSEVAVKTEVIATKAQQELEAYFGQKLTKRLIFVLYQNLSDFRQSNIGLNTDNNENNIGGVLKIVDNIAFIYNEGSLAKFEVAIRRAIAQIILSEMIFGSNIGSKIANNALISVPNWYVDGLAQYISEGWNSDSENQTKNILSKLKIKNLNYLNAEESAVIGQSIWNFVGTVYGQKVIPNIVYLTRVTKNIDNGFLYVLGLSYKDFQQRWLDYYKNQYEIFDSQSNAPEGFSLIKRSIKNTEYQQVTYNSNADKVAWVTNKLGRYHIKVYDKKTQKIKTILCREHKLEQIIDYSYPILRWHPSGKMLGFVIEKKGQIYLANYNFEDKKYSEREIAYLEKITGFDYSNDGQNVVFSGFNNGKSDLFIFNVPANAIKNITDDLADDFYPTFIKNSTQIIYSSNRSCSEDDIITIQKYNDIFVYDLKTGKIDQITTSDDCNEKNPYFFNGKYIYLSDNNGVYNIYESETDSAITNIDTTTHYNYFLNTTQLTNYKYSISDLSLDKFSTSNSFVYKNKNKFNLYYNEQLPTPININVPQTAARKILEKTIAQKHVPPPGVEKHLDTIVKEKYNNPLDEPVNINNYSFEQSAIVANKLEKENEHSISKTAQSSRSEKRLQTHKYHTTFYTNYLITQIDFGFLNNSYQKFTGSAFYFNPGFNVIFKVGTYDLFEDYRISAGARFSGNFDSNEFLISLEDLKYRWDKRLVLHRQVLSNINTRNYSVKTTTNELFYIMRYPFSQASTLLFTANLRMNRATYQSIDLWSLQSKDGYEFWGGLKSEFIFDNTKNIQTNILSGARLKIFGEVYNQLNKWKTDLFVVGSDLRYYLPIYKNFIFATRMGISYSFGHSKLIYYLGAIDNWINLSQKNPTFDSDIRIDPDQNYVYQAVATNLRGFSQNVRNGCNFAVLNAELRLPIFSFIFPRPITTAFFRDFQICGFFDVGSAWSGGHPFNGHNAYNDDIHDFNSIQVIIHNNNYPIVAGYGFGVRTSIFGYFIRADYAWGLENNTILSPMFYLSLGLDF